MSKHFSSQLYAYFLRAGLPLRRVASQAKIPHQTIHNWMRGAQPRWYAALPGDLRRLGSTLGLAEEEITLLLRLAWCIPAGPGSMKSQEVAMNGSYRMPKSWFPTGDDLAHYDLGVDPAVMYETRPCVTILCKPGSTGFAALAQAIKADFYCGKRLRFSAALRTQEVVNVATLWMRVEGPGEKLLAFDNMLRRGQVSGTTSWTRYCIVLDVAEGAQEIMFGFLLGADGQAWMADVCLEEVGLDVPVTDMQADIAACFPTNLSFEE